MSLQLIDPIVIKEKLERLAKRETRERKTKLALGALAWFGEYAYGNTTTYKADPVDGSPIAGTGVRQVDPEILIGGRDNVGTQSPPKLIVASSTPNADQAQFYIGQAYREARKAIVERAIALAQADLAANEVTEQS